MTALARRAPLARRLGQFGFAFFFVKGMAWLIIPAIGYWLA